MSYQATLVLTASPCASCGCIHTGYTHFIHKLTKQEHHLYWCSHCDYSTEIYVGTKAQALREWNALWEQWT